jgi:hypothetical protein
VVHRPAKTTLSLLMALTFSAIRETSQVFIVVRSIFGYRF